MNRNANQALNSFRFMQKIFSPGRSSFLGPGSEKKWYSTYIDRPRGEWDRIADPVFRSTSPLSRGTLKSKGGGKLSIHFCADGDTIETVFRTIISVNQPSIYGAVSDVCEAYGTCQTRTGRPVLAGQSDPLFEPASLLMKTPRPSVEIPAQENYFKSTKNEWKGFHNKIVCFKICIDAGFLTTVEVGQYFMTKDTEEFSQFTEPGWIRGNTKIGPVLEVTTSCLQGRYGVEIIFISVNKDNFHSWVRISHGLNKLVTELSNNKDDDNEQEISEMKFEEFALKTNARAFCKPIKG